MSSPDAGHFSATTPATDQASSNRVPSNLGIRALLAPLASLKLTVVMFALSLILVLAGTMAQIEHEIWHVVHQYFRPWFTWIDFQVFFPRAWELKGGFWFPGGKTIGAIMAVNLLAAHGLRFRITGKGKSLWSGLALLIGGVAFTWFVIQSGLDDTVESELSPAFCNGLWHAIRFALGGSAVASAYLLSLNYTQLTQSGKGWLWWLGAVLCALMLGLAAWLFLNPESKLDASGLRIMWQLIKAEGAALVLLAGCQGVFGRRAGIVLLHGGIALMMFSELWTGEYAQESSMTITEGETVNFSVDHRSTELVIVNKSDSKTDQVTIVPLELLLQSAKDQPLDNPALPFLVRVVDHQLNSSLRHRQPNETSAATHGLGLLYIADTLEPSTGVGQNQKSDVPSLHVELFSRQDKSSLGVFLLHPTFIATENLVVEEKPLEVSLRFKQILKPYSIKLVDFRFDRYVGTNKAKNYSSRVELIDDAQNVNREITISMNNPLRYHGDTLYQQSFDEKETTTHLQVTTNSGWMIPYTGCMIVGTGMLVQFMVTFLRFARKQVTPTHTSDGQSTRELLANWSSATVWVPTLILLLCSGYTISKVRTPKAAINEFHLYEFGQLPVAYNGRVKPFDSLARNALTVLSTKDRLKVTDPKNPEKTIQQPAIFWLLEYITATPASENHCVIRIESLNILQSLDLKPREGFRYSIAEITKKKHEVIGPNGEKIDVSEIMRQARLASGVEKNKRTQTQTKFLEISNKLTTARELQYALYSPAIPPESIAELKPSEKIMAGQIITKQINDLQKSAPRAIPALEPTGQWQTMLEAEAYTLLQTDQKEPNPAAVSLRKILNAYKERDTQEFNNEVEAYHQIIQELSATNALYEKALAQSGGTDGRKAAEKLQQNRVKFEAYFNHFNPFKIALALYLFAFALAACSWLGWNITLNRSANWLLWFTFALHTFALICRIYISGRPPVTNLYSSAVFIGWSAVLFALIFERIYRFGVGNLLAAAMGFPTLLIAYYLEGDGDTFQVLQAVLDTQFWLTTHVVCITLGYTTTLLAGVLGLVYILMSHLGGRLSDDEQKHLIRMIYGTICFAMFFSFIGTVLGGLWADDSWGRFWGWDPKENGALMIVIWNALVLHARWGAMIKNRGMALLAIFGNVITAWSWFGVNQMGVGLHAYGATEGRTLALFLFVLSQLAVMTLAFFPTNSQSPTDNDEVELTMVK